MQWQEVDHRGSRPDGQESASPTAPAPPPPSLEDLGRALVNLPHPVVVHRMGTVLWANNAAVKLVGLASGDEVVGRNCLEFVAPEGRAMARERVLALLRDGVLPGSSEVPIVTVDGRRMVGEATAALMQWQGEPAACMVFWDVTERHERVVRLHWESTHDPLTQLLNRRGVLDELARRVQASPAEAFGVGAILADLDRFKEVNDTLGHRCGDRVLVEVAQRLHDLAADQVVGRFGGDEFLIGLPIAERAGVAGLAQRIGRIVVAVREHEGLTVVPSVGAVWCRSRAVEVDALVGAADHAMYQAKRHGSGPVVQELSCSAAAT